MSLAFIFTYIHKSVTLTAWIGSPTSALARSRPISSVHHNTSSHPTKVTGSGKGC